MVEERDRQGTHGWVEIERCDICANSGLGVEEHAGDALYAYCKGNAASVMEIEDAVEIKHPDRCLICRMEGNKDSDDFKKLWAGQGIVLAGETWENVRSKLQGNLNAMKSYDAGSKII